MRPASWPMLATTAALGCLVVVMTACTATTGTGGSSATATPAATAAPTCATLLPGAAPAAPIAGFTEVTFPAGAVTSAATTTFGGTAQFKALDYTLCFTGAPDDLTGPFSAHHSVTANLLGAGWGVSTTFPYHGDAQQACAANCFHSDDQRYLGLENITTVGGGLLTYRLRLAAPPAVPACNSNFTTTPIPGFQTSINNVPLPPVSRVAPNNASGGVRGTDICSPGTAATVTAFLNAQMPAAGWTKVASDPRCIFPAQCWTKGANAISWSVTDPTDWLLAYRELH